MLRDILRRNKPSPLEATSVAMRMGAFPYLNSVEVGKQVKSSELTKNELIRDLYGKHTIEHPISFLLAFVSMDTHCWPPATEKVNEISPFDIHTKQS